MQIFGMVLYLLSLYNKKFALAIILTVCSCNAYHCSALVWRNGVPCIDTVVRQYSAMG